MASPKENIFVYGTLRRGSSNHFRMAGADYVAAGTVRGRLYQIDWYPGLVCDDSAGDDISGEIYQVSAEMIEQLDAFEGPGYRRVRVNVTLGDSSRQDAFLWEWLGECEEQQRIHSGDWLRVSHARS